MLIERQPALIKIKGYFVIASIVEMVARTAYAVNGKIRKLGGRFFHVIPFGFSRRPRAVHQIQGSAAQSKLFARRIRNFRAVIDYKRRMGISVIPVSALTSRQPKQDLISAP